MIADALLSSESNEWYTPERYLSLVRRVIGRIDLDPASSPSANRAINARRIFTIEEDALQRPWVAESVFLNPPYGVVAGKSQAGLFIQYMALQHGLENFKDGITLVNSCTGAKWFKPLFSYPICFVDHRIKFDVPPLPDNADTPDAVLRCILARKPPAKHAEITKKLTGWTAAELSDFYYTQNQPTKDNVFVYMGKRTGTFESVFSEIGTVK